MGREFELKYRADAAAIEAVRQRFGHFDTTIMETTYFDTPEGALRQRKWMLRLRMENGAAVCTLKTPLPDGSRGEWEVPCGRIQDAIPELCRLGAPRELAALTEHGVVPRCAAQFTRLSTLLDTGGGTAELALDQGEFLAGALVRPFAEIEVEGKSGSDDALRRFAEALAEEFSLSPEPESKAQRAFALAAQGKEAAQ